MSSSPSSASSSSFTVNLVSNSSMSIFSKNTLANFTTLLPNPIELPRSDGRTNGSWQVALLEISWPAKVQNVSQGVIKVVESSGSADNVVSSDYSPSDTSMAAVNNDDDDEEELEIRPRDNGRSVTFAPVASRNPTTTTTTTTTRNLSGQSTTLMLCANDDEDDDSEEITPQKEFALFSNAASKKRRRKMAPVRRKKSSKSSAEKSRASAVSSDFAASPPHFVHSDNSVGGALSAAAANRHSLLLPSEKTLEIERGHYNNVRQVLHTILKTAFGTSDRREWPFYCVINEPSQTIKIIPNLTGDDDDDNRGESTRTAADVVICLVSNDLRNILGVDCLQFLKPPSPASPNFPVDISAGRHTMFVYSDLVQCEVLGDRLTSLLRTVVLDHAAAAAGGGETFEYNSPAADYSKAPPPPPAFTVSHQSGGGGPAVVNYRSFAKLQWKKVVKTTIHSIKVSLMDETGELMPFLSVGRTCLTLMFRFVSNS